MSSEPGVPGEPASDDGPGPTFVHASIREAWRQTLGLAEADPAQRWDDAGGDSLAALHLLLMLEKGLGLKLPFETIRPETTLADLVVTAENAGTPVVTGAGPRIFLLPGLFGYEAVLRDLQVKLRDRASLEIVELPDMAHGEQAVSNLVASSRIVAAEIDRRQPEGRLFLGGYCIGGAMAFEAARTLARGGRRVAFLGILDTPLAAPTWPSWEDLIGFRIRAIHGWQPHPIRPSRQPKVSLLVASADFAARITPGWRLLLPPVRVFVVPGGHADVLRSSLQEVADIFEQAIADAVRYPEGRLAVWLDAMRRGVRGRRGRNFPS